MVDANTLAWFGIFCWSFGLIVGLVMGPLHRRRR